MLQLIKTVSAILFYFLFPIRGQYLHFWPERLKLYNIQSNYQCLT